MYKSLVVLCVFYCVVIEAYPSWQYLRPVPGQVPVYIRIGDTPLEEINPELAEAFHELPVGRSAGKELDASPDVPEQADQPQLNDDIPANADQIVDRRPYEKKLLEKKKKVSSDVLKPIERR